MLTFVNKQPIEAFMCSHYPLTPEREYYEQLAIQALRLNGLLPEIIRKKFLERYFEAERLASTEIYIFADNDLIPSSPTTIKQLVEIMQDNPEYSQLGLGWLEDMEPERSNSWKTGENGKIWDFDHVGGIVAIRKGSIKNLGLIPEYKDGYGDDRVMGATARRLGYKVGIVPSLYFYNLGKKHSTFKV